MRLDRKAFGRVATTFVATAMLAAFAAVPASAANTDPQVQTGTSISDITIDKVVKKPANAIMPNVTFKFTVDKADSTQNEGVLLKDSATGTGTGGSTVTLDVYNGMNGGVYLDTDTEDGQVTFGGTDNEGVGSDTLTGTFTLSVNANEFEHAGVYKYVIKEDQTVYDAAGTNSVTVEGLVPDNTTRNLYVYVENDDTTGKCKVVGAVVKGATTATDPTGKTDRFTNLYLHDGTNPRTNELIITKDVAGELGSLSQEFNFTVSIEASEENQKFYAEIQQLDTGDTSGGTSGTWKLDTSASNGGKVTLNAGANDFKLKDNQRLHIYGLSVTDNYTVVEIDAGQDGYTTTVDPGEDKVKNPDATNADKYTVTGSMRDKTAPNNIIYTNTRDSVTPTGVLLNVAPYALMVIIAAAGCFVFLRKRRDD
ncbi:hypothetical protein [uncultured Subdoligranulum sp.]|uniref:DUF7601 domain-containing protein n=1 Tax=uncultured Subdoligranulum sp. TaxID=512298 RepID=UPI0025E1A59D|nr:hypothetical protein [uncultured Subdoligranulum sp.]